MIYLLDTSVLIDLMRHKGPAEDFIASHIGEELTTSAICEAELNEGIYRENENNIPKRLDEKKKLFEPFSQIISFDSKQAEIAGQIRADLSLKGSLIGDIDILIAAAAISQNATLVTKNTKHFQKIPGLQLLSI